MYFQDLILKLQDYWRQHSCLLMMPYDLEKGAATFSPTTFLRALGPEPFNAAYVEACRRPTDGRYGENPIRMQHYYQFQVVMKPSPIDILQLYIDSLDAIGIKAIDHDIRFVHDDWESPTLGAWGLGWEVWVDGMEVTQFTYFQQVGGMELSPVMGEITYGLERLCMFLQNVENVYDIAYNSHLSYGDLFHQNEIQFSKHNFELADISLHRELFKRYEIECGALCRADIPISALDYCLKASHSFNLLDARGAISVSERQGYILRVRKLASAVAKSWLDSREKLNFPLINHEIKPKTGQTVDRTSKPLTGQRSQRLIDEFKSSTVPQRLPLLIELGVEEIPAKIFDSLLKTLPPLIDKKFKNENLDFQDINILSTPRRICITAASVLTRQDDQNLMIKGPPLKIAKNSNDKWTKAAIGFAKKNGIQVDELEIKKISDVDYVFASVTHAGRTALEVLTEAIPALFNSIPWYKTMSWGNQKNRFVRPVKWLVTLLGDWVIPTEFAGISSGNYSSGHRFLAPNSIKLNADREKYLELMRQAFVIADHHERRRQIKSKVNELAAEKGLVWKEDHELLDEVTNLVEYPIPIMCRFENKYLALPEKVLVSEMKEHQKYLALHCLDGTLSSYFMAISNMKCKNEKALQDGFERVLRSRFADAEFFLSEDLKISLDDRVVRLSQSIFQDGLGTIFDKVERIKQLAAYIGSQIFLCKDSIEAVERIATLCKADLNSLMVNEFPDLQGEIGCHYAICQGLPEIVSFGIRDHYLPKNINDAFPSSTEAAIVGVADRIDTLVGVFSLGKSPTGTADPFGLRRACLTTIATIVHMGIRIDLRRILEKSIEVYENVSVKLDKKDLESQLLNFFKVRVIGFFQEKKQSDSVPLDLIKSVMNSTPAWYDLTDLLSRLKAMIQFRKREDFDDVISTFKRINNILRNEVVSGEINEQNFNMNEEKLLWEAYGISNLEATKMIEKEDYLSALSAMAQLREPVDNFFEVVLVNDPDSDIRTNRKCLLHKLRDLLLRIADFSQLQVE